MTLPRISIITPCRNAAATIERALASVRDQAYQEVEHIVVDGASTDGTVDILRSAPGIRYVSEPDRGLSDALNKGLGMATGDVVGWLNADDFYLEGALALVGASFQDAAVLWAVGQCLIVDAADRPIRRPVTAYKNLLLARYSLPLLLTQNFVPAPSTFVRLAAYEKVGRFSEDLKYSMDYDVWLKLARLAPPAVINRPLAAFRMAEGSLSMSGFRQQFVEHEAVARANGEGHRLAVAVNAISSAAIILVYRALEARRRGRTRRDTPL